jgi:hypothetical protein
MYELIEKISHDFEDVDYKGLEDRKEIKEEK